MSDTIVACITGAQKAAVSWVRLSGPDSFRIAGEVFSPWPESPEPRKVIHGRYRHGDEGFALPFSEGQSFTGEESVELSVHGGGATVTALLQSCEAAGARPAGPGEFSLRAFMNGKIDLSQAEAIADTVEAETSRQLRAANMNREGRLSSRVRGIRENVLDLLSQIEACIDFSEEIGELDHSQIEVSARTLADALSAVLVEGRNAHLVRRGLRVAILGRPNAGKSSLLNALVGIDRAIVSDVPGTTRDTVEEAIEVDGIRIVLTDTAGLRETEDTVESLGVERSKRAADTADLILCVFDSEVGWTQEDESFVRSCAARVLVVGNKCDLSVPDRGLPVSCKTGEGVPILMKAMVEGLADLSEMPPVNERQGAALSLALDSLRACAEAASAMRPPDLLCVLLGEAVSYLGRVTGETATPDMLEEIFSRFCIGK